MKNRKSSPLTHSRLITNLILLMATLLMTPSIYAANVYRTTVDWVPDGSLGTSLDPAFGDRLIVTWSTEKNVNLFSLFENVDGSDLIDLTIELYGNKVNLLYTDKVLIDRVVQPIENTVRPPPFFGFSFGPVEIPNNFLSNGISLDNLGDDNYLFFVDSIGVLAANEFNGEDDRSTSTAAEIYTQTTTLVPIPAAIWLFASAIFCLMGIKRFRFNTSGRL